MPLDLAGIHMDAPTVHPVEAIAPGARHCGAEWSHLWCDAGREEALHAVARALHLSRTWFQNKPGRNFPHYDLTAGKYWQAVRLGVPVMALKDWLKERR